MPPVANTLAQHSSLGGLAIGFLLLGSLINSDITSHLVRLDSLLDCNASLPSQLPAAGGTLNQSEFAPGFAETAIFVAVATPLVPFILQPAFLDNWSQAKSHALGSHVLGQSTSFGFSELLRFLDLSPNDLFVQRCNLTAQECLAKKDKVLKLFGSLSKSAAPLNSSSGALCSHPGVLPRQVYDSLHTFPNCLGSMLGSGLVSFILCALVWSKLKSGGADTARQALRRSACFALFLSLCGTLAVFVWGGDPREETLVQKIMSVAQGVLMQAVISAIFLTQHQDHFFALFASAADRTAQQPDQKPRPLTKRRTSTPVTTRTKAKATTADSSIPEP